MNRSFPEDCMAAHAPGYPKIPNVPHQRQEIDLDALQEFMPVDTTLVVRTLCSQAIYKILTAPGGPTDNDLAWSMAFTVPALFARVQNLEAQVYAGWSQVEHLEDQLKILVSQQNVRFTSDRRANTDYRMQITETGKMEDRNCFGLPTVVTVQVHVPRTSSWSGEDAAVYEGKYVLLHNHLGEKAMTSAALAEEAVERLTCYLPGPFTEREDPGFIVGQAVTALKNRSLLLRERTEFKKNAQAIEDLIVQAQSKLDLVQKRKSPMGNVLAAQTLLHSLLDRFIELRGEEPTPSEEEL